MRLRSVRIGITVFLWFTSLLAIVAIVVLCAGSLSSMQVVGQKARDVRQVKLPEVEETQRSMINIESLRRLAEVVYLSNDPQARRTARIRAQAMSTESVFTQNNDYAARTKTLIARINTLSSIRDKEIGFKKRLDDLLQAFLTSTFVMARQENGSESFTPFMEPALSIISSRQSTHNTTRESIARSKRERAAVLDSLKTVEKLCSERAASTPVLHSECERQKAFQSDYAAIVKDIDVNTAEAFETWQGVDEALREMRDVVRTDAEFETKDALTSIENTSEKAIDAALWLAVAGVLFFALYLGVLHFVLVRPVRWAGRKLQEIQQGILDTPAPAIHITELYRVGDLLDRFSAHIAELTSHASQLAEDAAEKRDLEELMAAVFRLSVDGYIIWAPGEPSIINTELLRLLGYDNAGEVEANWKTIGLTSPPELAVLFERIKADGIARKEINVTTAQGEHIPFEVTYIPIKRQNGTRALSYFRDLRQQKLTEETLRTAKDRAEEAAQVKSDFLARMSHEIRTPMNGVLGLTGIALRESPPPAQKLYLEKIQASARILLRVINDILDFSKLESDKFELDHASFPFARMLTTATDLFSFQAEEKGLSFTVESSPDVPDFVVGDELRLSQVLLNLCGNAMKFTERGGVTVKVALENQSDTHLRVRFSIIDTGIGMTEEQIGALFKPFSQADSSTTRKYGGTGLGLVISDMLVTMMQGTISVVSTPGQGSTFSFDVLLEKSVAPAIEVDAKRAPAVDVSGTLRGLRVLLVEDNEINQEVATALLDDLGCTTVIAGNGQEALRILEQTVVDCVLMDIQMPVMDGLTATRAIRRDPRPDVSSLPIIAMTAHAMQEDRDKSLRAGMNLHITKPIDFEELRAALLLATRGAEGTSLPGA